MDCTTNLDDYLKIIDSFKNNKYKVFDQTMDDLEQIKNYSFP